MTIFLSFAFGAPINLPPATAGEVMDQNFAGKPCVWSGVQICTLDNGEITCNLQPVEHHCRSGYGFGVWAYDMNKGTTIMGGCMQTNGISKDFSCRADNALGAIGVTVNGSTRPDEPLSFWANLAPSPTRFNLGDGQILTGVINGDDGGDSIRGSYNDDGDYLEYLNGDDGVDVISGNPGIDIMDGGDDDDIMHGGDDRDEMYGGSGEDIMNGNSGPDTIFGGEHDDTIDGGDDSDHLFGEDGSDTLVGGEGNDKIHGGKHNDSIDGEDGNDVMYGGTDTDVMVGGSGNDIFCETERYTTPLDGCAVLAEVSGGNRTDKIWIERGVVPGCGWSSALPNEGDGTVEEGRGIVDTGVLNERILEDGVSVLPTNTPYPECSAIRVDGGVY